MAIPAPAPYLQEIVTNAYHILTSPPDLQFWGAWLIISLMVIAALAGTALCALAEVVYARARTAYAARPEPEPEPEPTADGKLSDD